jgi:hypothetical protein
MDTLISFTHVPMAGDRTAGTRRLRLAGHWRWPAVQGANTTEDRWAPIGRGLRSSRRNGIDPPGDLQHTAPLAPKCDNHAALSVLGRTSVRRARDLQAELVQRFDRVWA